MRRLLALMMVASALAVMAASAAGAEPAATRCTFMDVDAATQNPCVGVGAASFPAGAVLTFASDIPGGASFQLIGEAAPGIFPMDPNSVIKFTDVPPGTYTISGNGLPVACDGAFDAGTVVFGADSFTLTVDSGEFITCDFLHGTPEVSVEKHVSVTGPSGPWASQPSTLIGADVWIRISVENVGDTNLDNFAVTDVSSSGDGVDYQSALNAALGTANCPNVPSLLAPLDIWECVIGPFTALEGLHENTATVTSDWIFGSPEISDSDSADYVGAEAVVYVDKIVVGGPAAPGDFVLQVQDQAGNPVGDTADPSTETCSAGDIDDAKCANIGLTAGTHRVVEEVPPYGYELTAVACSPLGGAPTFSEIAGGVQFDLVAGDAVHCTFTNEYREVSLFVDKVVGGPATVADFTLEIEDAGGALVDSGLDPSDATCSVGDLDTANCAQFTLPIGSYTVLETGPSGYQLGSVSCVTPQGQPALSPVPGGVQLDLTGEDVLCTFTNTFVGGSITVVKDADPANGTQFEFGGDLGLFSLSSGESLAISGLTPGTYAVGELELFLPTGTAWPVMDIACDGQSVTYGGDSTFDLGETGVVIQLGTGEDVTCTFRNRLARIGIVKSAAINHAGSVQAGDTITYTYQVTNNGVLALSDLEVFDDNAGVGPISCAPVGQGGTLDPAAATTCTASYTITQSNINVGSVENFGFRSGKAPDGQSVTEDDGLITTLPQTPAIDVEKRVRVRSGDTWGPWEDADIPPGPSVFSDERVRFNFRVRNTGNTTLTSVSLLDPDVDLSGCSIPDTLVPGELASCTANGAWALGQQSNTATVTALQFFSTTEVQDSDNAHFNGLVSPGLEVVKRVRVRDGGVWGPWLDADSGPGPSVGINGAVRFNLRVVNTGDGLLTAVTLTDADVDLSGCVIPSSLAPGAAASCSVNGEWALGEQVNTAMVTADTPGGLSELAFDSAYFTGVGSTSINLVKRIRIKTLGVWGPWMDANGPPGPSATANQSIRFNFRVTNIGDFPLTNVNLSDSRLDISGCSLPSELAPGEKAACTVPAPWRPGEQFNAAHVSAFSPLTQGTVFAQDGAYYLGAVDEHLCEAPGAISVGGVLADPDFAGPQPSEVVVPISGLSYGYYDAYFVSFDTHSTKPIDPTQAGESWFFELLDVQGQVFFTSEATPDIDDLDDYAFGWLDFFHIGEVEPAFLRVSHADPPGANPNSVQSLCVYFNPAEVGGE